VQTLPRNLAEFTADLFGQPRHKALAKKFLPALISIIQKSDRAVQEVVRGLVTSLRTRTGAAVELLRSLAEALPETISRPFWKQVVREAFLAGTPEYYHLVLQAANEKDRGYLFEYLALLAVDGQIPADGVVEALRREWDTRQQANRPVLLRSLLVAAVLLGSAAEPLHHRMLDEFRSALRKQDQPLADPLVAKLVGVAVEEILQTRRQLEERLSSEVETLEAQLSDTQSEIERVRRNADDLHQQLARRREESRLEIRRDMLLAIGETLQMISQKDRKSVELMADLEAGLSLALQGGGAEVLGRVGQEVSYDARLHQADENVEQGAPVVIVAPGVLVRGDQHGDLVLLKARTVRQEHKSQ